MSKKPQVTAEEETGYFKEATDWDHDQAKRTKESEQRAWKTAGLLGLIALLSVCANFMLFPLKQIEHNIVRVDTVTGVVDVQRIMKDGKDTYNEATDKYWMWLYVRNREGYLHFMFDEQYKTVGLLSAQQLQQTYYESIKQQNPNSPLNRYGTNQVKLKYGSINFISKGVATVRFTKTITDARGRTTQPTYWIATMKYRYVRAPESEAERNINPLGFQVSEYRVDPESDFGLQGGMQ